MKNLAITILLALLAFSCSNPSDSEKLSNTSIDVENNVITVELEQGTVTFTNCFDLQNFDEEDIDSIAHIAAEEALVHIQSAEIYKSDADKVLESQN